MWLLLYVLLVSLAGGLSWYWILMMMARDLERPSKKKKS